MWSLLHVGGCRSLFVAPVLLASRHGATANVTGDPRFYGALGERFDFKGTAGASYCLVADARMHINMHLFASTRLGENSSTDLLLWLNFGSQLAAAARQPLRCFSAPEYIDEIGILGGGMKVLISAHDPPGTLAGGVHGHVAVNGAPLLQAELALRQGPDLTVDRTATSVTVAVHGLLNITAEIARGAFWPSKGPGQNFINLRVNLLKGSNEIHGVLGHTFRDTPEERARVAASRGRQVAAREAIFLEGSEEDYRTSSILQLDCKFARYHGREDKESDIAMLQLPSGRRLLGKPQLRGIRA
eukprot:jgi/Mesen1/4219/ME000219S03346